MAAAIDETAVPHVVAVTAGEIAAADNQFLDHFLGRRFQNRLVHVPTSSQGREESAGETRAGGYQHRQLNGPPSFGRAALTTSSASILRRRSFGGWKAHAMRSLAFLARTGSGGCFGCSASRDPEGVAACRLRAGTTVRIGTPTSRGDALRRRTPHQSRTQGRQRPV